MHTFVQILFVPFYTDQLDWWIAEVRQLLLADLRRRNSFDCLIVLDIEAICPSVVFTAFHMAFNRLPDVFRVTTARLTVHVMYVSVSVHFHSFVDRATN